MRGTLHEDAPDDAEDPTTLDEWIMFTKYAMFTML